MNDRTFSPSAGSRRAFTPFAALAAAMLASGPVAATTTGPAPGGPDAAPGQPPSSGPASAPAPQPAVDIRPDGPAARPPLTRDQRAAILAALRDRIARNYVDQRRRGAIVAALVQRERAGTYDLAEPMAFSARVTRDLKEIAADQHMALIFAPDVAPLLNEGGRISTVTPAVIAAENRQARRSNHGIREMRIFPGNVRYVRFQTFNDWIEYESARAYDGAMTFLAGADAIILDLRGNSGGQHEPYIYLMSHFTAPGTLLFRDFDRGELIGEKLAMANLPAGSLAGKPLYLLTDGNTGSASEFVAYDVRERRLGEIIGTRTAGAAYRVRGLPLPHGFVANVSVGSPVFPLTGGNWEGQGIAPDVEVPADLALDTALLRATERLAENASSEQRPFAEQEVGRLRAELARRTAVPRRPYLGFANVPGSTSGEGVPIAAVQPRGTLGRIGVQEGDVLIEGNGIPIVSEAAVEAFIGSARTGEPIRVKVRRNGRTLELSGQVVGRTNADPISPW